MRVASHMLAYNVCQFLPDAVDNAAAHVERLFVALPTRPWAYNPAIREERRNSTTIERFRSARYFDRIEFIEGDWWTEEAMRNDCLEQARKQGFDWLIAQDADEFYTEQSWRQITHYLSVVPNHVLAVRTTWYNFWKSAQYILVYDNGSIKDMNANFALRCASDVRFLRARVPTDAVTTILDAPCFHFGWVLSDSDMAWKIQTWKHTTEFNPERWFEIKWKGWTERSRYLHPVHPTFWDRAVRTPFELPDFAQKYAPSIEIQSAPRIGNLAYDVKYRAVAALKRLRRRLQCSSR
ncbi:MAG TPA: hypothetical protein VIY68_02240 [Steroidobacteraceae bacterium]